MNPLTFQAPISMLLQRTFLLSMKSLSRVSKIADREGCPAIQGGSTSFFVRPVWVNGFLFGPVSYPSTFQGLLVLYIAVPG